MFTPEHAFHTKYQQVFSTNNIVNFYLFIDDVIQFSGALKARAYLSHAKERGGGET